MGWAKRLTDAHQSCAKAQRSGAVLWRGHCRDLYWGWRKLLAIDPVTALFCSAFINGVVAEPVMIMLLTKNMKVMSDFPITAACAGLVDWRRPRWAW